MNLFKIMRIRENIEIWLGNHKNGNNSNVGFINDDCVYAFDTSYSPDFFYKYIIRLSSFGKAIVVVLSHHHNDHINGILGLKDSSNVSVICSSSIAEKLKANINNIIICKKDICLNGDIFVRRCVNCHTSEDLVLEDIKNRVVFMGDMLMDCHHPYINNKNVKQWVKCLEKFKNKKFDYYIPGHGEGMSRNVVEHYISYLNLLIEATKINESKKSYNERAEIFLNQSKSLAWKQKENIRKNFEFLQK